MKAHWLQQSFKYYQAFLISYYLIIQYDILAKDNIMSNAKQWS